MAVFEPEAAGDTAACDDPERILEMILVVMVNSAPARERTGAHPWGAH